MNIKDNNNNYPVPYAGCLEVKSNGTEFTYQIYHSFGDSNNIYIRNRYNTTWYAWKLIS